jgi:predicted dehydrogenase
VNSSRRRLWQRPHRTGRILGANDRIRVGGIGTGGRCQYLLDLLNKGGGSQIVAICDVYGPHLDEAREKVAPEARAFTDYRKVLELPTWMRW